MSVSNERYYHGYPKLIHSLYDYYKTDGRRRIIIKFVGDFKTSTKLLVDKYNLSQHVFFLGKKSGEELNEIYDNADLGIGALAPRAGAEYGSSIKTKEYFAKGLPFINGWKEYAFDDSYPYVKRFSLNEENIDFKEIISFYESIKEDKNMKESMRLFAEKNYTWKSQFEKIFL